MAIPTAYHDAFLDISAALRCGREDISARLQWDEDQKAHYWKLVISSSAARPRFAGRGTSILDAFGTIRNSKKFREWRKVCGCCPYHTRGGDAFNRCCEHNK